MQETMSVGCSAGQYGPEIVEPLQDIDWSVDDYVGIEPTPDLPDYTQWDIRRALQNYPVMYDRQVDIRAVPTNVKLHNKRDWWLESNIAISVDIERAMAALAEKDPWAHQLILCHHVGGYEMYELQKIHEMKRQTFKRFYDRGMNFLEEFLNGPSANVLDPVANSPILNDS